MAILRSDNVELWSSVAEVDVWRFELDCERETIDELHCILNADELQRAAKYRTEQLRSRFVVARGTTRIILAGYLKVKDPTRISFEYGSHGKPSLSECDWRFNLAHSHGLALLAVSKHSDVGIDLEWIDHRVEIEDIAIRFFTPEECAEMLSHFGVARSKRFFDLWCCKEAYLKAVGVGISGGLNRCRIVDAADGTVSVVNPTDLEESSQWRIHRLDPGSGYAGALCVQT